MKHRTFGTSGLRVARLALGTMLFGHGSGVDRAAAERILGRYGDAGGNLIDTANAYGGGASETMLGELLGPDRDRFVLATKYTLSPGPTDANASGNHRLSLVRSVEESLRRLRTDRIDLLWVHIWDPSTPVEETMRGLDDLVAAGKVLYIGLSDTPAWVVARAATLAQWRGWSPPVAIQVPYSLAKRDVERELLPMARDQGLSVLAWAPLAAGLLAGRLTRPQGEASTRLDRDRVSDTELEIAATVDRVADDLGVSSGQVALAWLLAQDRSIHPLVGPRTAAHLDDAIGALELTLPEDALARLDAVSRIELGFPSDFAFDVSELD
ncbi:aldo/keto reductase [Nitriliruptor alkaliphilus]|uniref:aldo/keto reductase n=1 Tax=Nitriliruptor alkaliphilus TaxID=427918 RepID=UPI00069884E7|nr:aldo/keto reductase [Nitriliruptor alkaliphilus]